MTPELYQLGYAILVIPIPVMIIYNALVWYNQRRHGNMYKNAIIALRDVCDKIDAARAGYPVDNMYQLLGERAYLLALVESYEGR